MSICNGIDEIIDRHFKITDIGKPPHYQRKSSCLHLSSEGQPDGFDSEQMFFEMLGCLEKNWAISPRRTYANPSDENWRFQKQLHISKKNTSQEKILEKEIAKIASENWVNQVPTASGLWDRKSDKHRNIDLVHRLVPKQYEFIELKVASDNPLKAAMEILLYGILYILSRIHYDTEQKQTKELLQAETIHLRILAPFEFYNEYNLGWLETTLNSGLKSFISNIDKVKCDMDFQFETFPEDFDVKTIQNKCLDAIHKKYPVWR